MAGTLGRGGGCLSVVQTGEWPGSQALGQRQGSWGGEGGGRTGWAPPPLVATPAPLDSGQEHLPGGRPQGLPCLEVERWESSVGLDQRPHPVVGRARASPEKWEFPVLQTTAEQKTGRLGLGGGGGAPGSFSQPSAGPGWKFTAPEPSDRAVSARTAAPGAGGDPIRLDPGHLQLTPHTGRVTIPRWDLAR